MKGDGSCLGLINSKLQSIKGKGSIHGALFFMKQVIKMWISSSKVRSTHSKIALLDQTCLRVHFGSAPWTPRYIVYRVRAVVSPDVGIFVAVQFVLDALNFIKLRNSPILVMGIAYLSPKILEPFVGKRRQILLSLKYSSQLAWQSLAGCLV